MEFSVKTFESGQCPPGTISWYKLAFKTVHNPIAGLNLDSDHSGLLLRSFKLKRSWVPQRHTSRNSNEALRFITFRYRFRRHSCSKDCILITSCTGKVHFRTLLIEREFSILAQSTVRWCTGSDNSSFCPFVLSKERRPIQTFRSSTNKCAAGLTEPSTAPVSSGLPIY